MISKLKLLSMLNVCFPCAVFSSVTIRAKPHSPWFSAALSKIKSARRHLERLGLRTCASRDLKSLLAATYTHRTENIFHVIFHDKKCSTLLSTLHPPRVLANFGAPPLSFFTANPRHNLFRTLIQNLNSICLPLSFPRKFATFNQLVSRNAQISYLTSHLHTCTN